MIAEPPPALDAVEFDRLMMPFAPFERPPSIAVAVSGGRDSLALALLSRDWIAARGGTLVALIVDHGLRAESRTEAEAARAILGEQGIDAAILTWSGDKPRTGLQEAARANRYRLLRDECRRRGILHLLLAHHADDQAETLAMRAVRNSGPDGLSGMAAVIELPELRLLRPLLGVARSRLGATLRSRSVRWLDDPSNLDLRFERVRVRLAPPLRVVGTEPAVRHAREQGVAEAAVALLELDQTSAAAFDRDAFARLAPDLQVRLLSRLVQGLGGRDHPPRQDRLAAACRRLCQAESGGKSGRAQDFTLAGCRLVLRSSKDREQPALSLSKGFARGPGSHGPRMRWIVRPENGRYGGKPLFPAAFFACFACSMTAATHLECNPTPTDIGQ